MKRLSVIAALALAVSLVPNHASAVTKLKTKVYAEAFVNDPEDLDNIEGFLVFVGSKSSRCAKERNVTVTEYSTPDFSDDGEVFGFGVTAYDEKIPAYYAVIDGDGAWHRWYRFTVAKVRRGNVVCLARSVLFFYEPPPPPE